MKDLKLNRIDGTDLEGDKRQHAPYELTWTCACGEQCLQDFSCDIYLSHPKFGDTVPHYLYCNKCGAEPAIKLRVDLTLEVVP